MVKDIICVACPMGCQISVELNDGGEILSVTGTPASAATPMREPSAPTPREA